MFHFAVCCYERKYIKMICGYLQELWQEDYAVETIPFTRGADLLSAYKNGEHFDVIVLDTATEEFIDQDILQQIYQYDTNVTIIISTTQESVVESYKASVYRCILKPINKELFLTEISVLLARLAIEENIYYKFANGRGLNKVKLSDVYYFESNMRNIRIYEKGNEYIFTGKISDVENELAKQDFVRNHKSYVVNLKYVRNIYKDTIIMENDEKIPLSKHRSKKMRERVSHYMKARR
ncbi:MAG: DNA-binding response regulator [Acidaminococcaceae bacterium]|nr:DNA-binding response regulator [Acidaminococcaceae bacterium]MDD4721290.1 DNA-binding response regulator [Acidaminococcaceae bacterium]